jgi:spermidine/putrescine transport system substrate-binding protein
MSAFSLTRRRFNHLLGTGALAGLASGWSPGRLRAAEEITVLNWQGYGTDEAWALKGFAEKTGITVKHDYYNSEPEMVTKLQTNPGVYDVVVVNSARIQQVAADDLLAPTDFDKIPNAKGLSTELKDNANLAHDGTVYGCAWVWGMNALGVRNDLKTKPDSFAVLKDPAYAGRAALFDDAVTEIGVGALLTGQDINDPADLAKVKAELQAMKPNVKLLWSSEDQWNKAFAAGEFDVSVYWSGAAVRSLRNFKLPVEFIVPKEGAIGWLDGLAVPATSEKKDAAFQFINLMIDPAFYYKWATEIGAPASASAAAMATLPADDLSRQIHAEEYLTKLQFMGALPDERRTAFNDLWTEMKALYAQ